MRTSYNGTVEATFTSLAFGDAQTTASGSETDPYYFASFDYDSETTTSRAQFRQYNSTQGRWTSPDPYGGSYDFSNPQTLNRYAYAGNNPVAMTDPSGLDENDCWDWVWCGGGGGGGGWGDGGDGGDDGCDPTFYDCGGPGGWVGPISTPQPRFRGYKDLDPIEG